MGTTNNRGWILVGDKTSHGGVVLTGSATFTPMGKGVARVGDKVSCPKCKGTFEVAEGCPTHTDQGRMVALHGHKTTCGAILLSGEARSSGGSSTVVSSSLFNANNYSEKSHDEFFVFKSETTENPISHQECIFVTGDGKAFTGTTDEFGRTGVIATENKSDKILIFIITEKRR